MRENEVSISKNGKDIFIHNKYISVRTVGVNTSISYYIRDVDTGRHFITLKNISTLT